MRPSDDPSPVIDKAQQVFTPPLGGRLMLWLKFRFL
jgi:hypothetical protein